MQLPAALAHHCIVSVSLGGGQRLADDHSAGRFSPSAGCDACGGILKPATISFGQSMPERETREAQERSAACDLFLVAGSSLVVYPAAQMPLVARSSGAKLVIVNLTATPHDQYADAVIHEKTGPALSGMVEGVKARLGK